MDGKRPTYSTAGVLVRCRSRTGSLTRWAMRIAISSSSGTTTLIRSREADNGGRHPLRGSVYEASDIDFRQARLARRHVVQTSHLHPVFEHTNLLE